MRFRLVISLEDVHIKDVHKGKVLRKRMPQGIESFFSLVSKTAKENEGFFNENAKYVVSEVVDLVNDAIDCMILFTKQENPNEIYVKQSLAFYVYHVLMPASYSILTNFSLGNVPSCFRELRFMIESLAKCYLADLKYPHQSFFQAKLELLQKERRNEKDTRKREHDFMEEFDRKLGLNRKSVKLWGRLSQEVHTKRYVERVVDHVIEKSDIPAYVLVIPMSYTKGDLEDLQDLYNCICDYRKTLNTTMERYKSFFNLRS